MRKCINKKSWRRLFLYLAMISLLFTIIITAANGSLFTRFFTIYEKGLLRSCADTAGKMDLADRESATKTLNKLEDEHSVQINLYQDGRLIYSTLSQSIYTRPGLDGFDLLIGSDNSIEITDKDADGFGGTFYEAQSATGTEYTVYSRDYSGRTVEVMIKNSIIDTSAAFAMRFIMSVMLAVLILMLIASVWLSMRFTKPITQMNEAAQRMTQLDFTSKVEVDYDDELGELAQSLNTLSDSLHTALQQLQEKNERLEDEIEAERRIDEMRKGFVVNVSHELKTPLAIIQGYAEGLVDGVADDEEKRRHYCEVIKDESERMHKLVIRLLELSRYEGGFDLNKEVFDLSASVLNIIDVYSEALESRGIDLEIDMPERLLSVGDAFMLEQVMQNYVSNALSHVDDGGRIKIYTEPYNDGMRLCVYNSGSQVDYDDLEKVWQSFYRADKSHNRAQGRFGLGLSIVKAIMVAHGSDFGVFNTDDGVVFWLEILVEG